MEHCPASGPGVGISAASVCTAVGFSQIITLRPEGFAVHGRGSAEVDTVIDPLLRELDRRADEVRLGHTALDDLPCLPNEAPTELPSGDLPLERAAAGMRQTI